MDTVAKDIIQKLKLEPLTIEGGFFRQTYKSKEQMPQSVLLNHSGDRSFMSCIYYLITKDDFSRLHRLPSIEVFHFYAGDPVEMTQISENGELKTIIIGNDILEDQTPQVIVPPNTWQGMKMIGSGQWALMGCSVSPGFEYCDFEAGTNDGLIKSFPQHKDIILNLT